MPEISNNNPLRSAELPSTYHEILNKLHRQLNKGEEEQWLEWDSVDTAIAEQVDQELERTLENQRIKFTYDSSTQTLCVMIMPQNIRECHVPWLNVSWSIFLANGLLTLPELKSIAIHGSTRFTGFLGRYTSSRKEPDAHIIPDSLNMPTIVVESGWSESRVRLHRDRDLWLIGGRGSVNVAIIIKWTKTRGNKVSGDIEVFDLDPQGAVRSLQREVIFPIPPPNIANRQEIYLTRGQIFGAALPVGQNAAQIFSLELNNLRHHATVALGRMGLVPAH